MTEINIEKHFDSLNNMEFRLRKAYYLLYSQFNFGAFKLEQAEEVFADNGIKKSYEILSKLRKSGMIKVTKDIKDARTSIYSLDEISKEELSIDQMISMLYTSPSDPIPLFLIFYKQISDKWQKVAGNNKKNYLKANEIFTLYSEVDTKVYSWENFIQKDVSEESLKDIINTLAKLNSNYRDNLLCLNEYIEGSTTPYLKYTAEMIDSLSFSEEHNREPNKNFDTHLSSLLAGILELKQGDTLLEMPSAAKPISLGIINSMRSLDKKKKPDIKVILQNKSPDRVMTGFLFFMAHMYQNLTTGVGDCFNIDNMLIADKVISKPPFNQKMHSNSHNELLFKALADYVYKYGGFASFNNIDWSWIQIVVHAAREKAVIFIDPGALSRSGREQEHRRLAVLSDELEAIIEIATDNSNKDYGLMLVFNKDKSWKSKVLFIHSDVNDHAKITEIYRNGITMDGISRLVEFREIEEKNFNLNVGLYIISSEIPVKTINHRIDIYEEYDRLKILSEEENNSLSNIGQSLKALKKGHTVKDKLTDYDIGTPNLYNQQELKELILNYKTLTSGLKLEPYDGENGVLVLDTNFIGDAEFYYNENKQVRISPEQADELNQYVLSPGEIIISRAGDNIGRAAMLPDIEKRYLLGTELVSITVDANKIDPHYLLLFLNSDSFRYQVFRESINNKIGLRALLSLNISVPPHEEQMKAKAIIQSVERYLQLERDKVKALQNIRKNILTNLLDS